MKQDLAVFDLGMRGKQSQDGVRQRAFSAARFSEDSEDFCWAEVDRDLVEGREAFAIWLGVGDVQALNAK